VTRQMSLPAGSSSMTLRRSGVQPVPGAFGFTFRDVIRILRRRLWWLIIITIVATGFATGACFLLRRYRPMYTSTGMVICKVPIQEDLLRGYTPIPNKDLIALETANQAAYLASEAFLNDVLGRGDIQRTKWFKGKRDPKSLLEDLKSSFSARAQRGTEYVIVQMSNQDKGEAKEILDLILEQYRTNRTNQATERLSMDRTALKGERDQIDSKIITLRQTLNNMRQQANVPGWDQDRTVIMDELSTMNREKIILAAQMKDMQLRRQQLLKERNTQGYTSTVQAAVDQDPIVMGFRSQIFNYQTNLDGLGGRLGVEHQSVKQIQSLIESLRKQMLERERMLQQQYAVVEEQAINNRIESLQDQLTIAISELQRISDRQIDLDRQRAQYEEVQREIEDLTRTKLRFEDRIYATNVAEDNERRKQEQIVPGTRPLTISFPRYGLFVPGGFFVGLLLSLGLIFLLEFIDDSIKTPSDVVRHLQAPLLGMIPEYDEEDAEDIELAKVCSIHPQEVISESFRQIRTNLYFSAPLEELKVMLITSSGAGCGKTTAAVNLGITFASEGKRVLLVDANFRRAALNRLFPIEAPPRGLSNVLVGQASAADVIRSAGIEGLDVMDAGPVPPNPAVLLSSERMQKLLTSQRDYYDHIIIDGPPALLLTDARILAGQVDGTIMVVHAGNTSRGVVGRMLRELKTDQVRILGVLLNAVRPQKGGYFRETYRSYYDYISPEPEREPEPVAALPETPDVVEGDIPPADES